MVEMGAVKPKISVLMCAYNAGGFINEALLCIKHQTFQNFECIVVDDGSSDDTADIIKGISRGDGRFRLLRHKHNKGLPAARNRALRSAKGEHLIMLDADDVFDENLLKMTHERAEETAADIVVFNFDEYKTRKKRFQRKIIDESVVPDLLTFAYDDLVVADGAVRLEALSNMSSNKLYKRKFITKNNLIFNEKLLRNQDLEFGLRAYMLASKITFIPKSLITYKTQIPTSNQANLSKCPTLIFDALTSLRSFFVSEGIYRKFKHDLNDLAVHHIVPVFIKNSPSGQRQLLAESAGFFQSFGINGEYISKLDNNKQNMLSAMIQNDFDAYLLAERMSLLEAIEDITLRVPSLEARIQLELKELSHYRDNPSLKTALIILKRALRGSLRRA